jgi:CheY-like chemotaxis protein
MNMAAILRARDFRVSTAFNGYEAVDVVKSGKVFDVVVLDFKMPGMDGLAAMAEIKTLSPDTEVIMLTGHASLSSGTRAIREGAFDYLMKPCDIEDLVEKIREAHETETIKRHPVLWPRKLVGEIALSPFRGLRPEDPLSTALEMMSRASGEEAIEEAYVLDREDQLQGVVTKRALLKEAQKAHPGGSLTWQGLVRNSGLLPQKGVAEIIQRYQLATAPNAYLTDVANQMIVHSVRFMPVIRAGRMLGIIRMQDILRYIDSEIA